MSNWMKKKRKLQKNENYGENINKLYKEQLYVWSIKLQLKEVHSEVKKLWYQYCGDMTVTVC